MLTEFQLTWYRFLRTKHQFSKRQNPMPARQAYTYAKSFTSEGSLTVEQWKSQFPKLYWPTITDNEERMAASERKYQRDLRRVPKWRYLDYPSRRAYQKV